MSRTLEMNFNRILLVGVALLFATTSGCRKETDYGSFNDYGKIHGQEAGYASVDGLSGLITLLRNDGRTVRRAPRISPLIDRFDTIVWCPNRTVPPSDEVIDRLETWLAEGHYRSIIFVAPGFRGKNTMMQQRLAIVPDSGPEKEKAIRRYNEHLTNQRFSRYENRFAFMMPSESVEGECKWFTQESAVDRKITNMEGQWSDVFTIEDADLRTGKLKLNLKDDLEKAQSLSDSAYYFGNRSYERDSESLLEHSDGVLLSRIFCPDQEDRGQIFVFSNGSALMNLGLANAQNRKIAGWLIDETSGPVMLLESGPAEIEVRNTYSPNESGWEWLTREPIGNIVPFFLLLSVVAFFAVFPIHGRPRHIDLEKKKTFRHHINATGRLLKSNSNRNWALEVIRRYKKRSKDK